MRATVSTLLVFALSGCSFIWMGPQRCPQSNGAAGVDLTLTAASTVIAASVLPDPKWYAAPAWGTAVAGTAASTVYGFVKSYKCRERRRGAGLPTRGGADWIIAPAVVLTAGLVAAAMSPRRRGSSVVDPDLCRSSYEPRTALCNDGVDSCSKHRQGTCSWHGGVAVWY